MKPLVPAFLLLASCAPGIPVSEPEAPLAPAFKDAPIPFAAPEGWTKEEPGNRLRVAQYKVPDKEKKSDPALFVLSTTRYWSEELKKENIGRWAGQMGGEPHVESFQGKHPVTVVDLSGNYSSDFDPEPISNARMLVAVVEADRPWFFKLVGPAGTVGGWHREFVEMVKGAGP